MIVEGDVINVENKDFLNRLSNALYNDDYDVIVDEESKYQNRLWDSAVTGMMFGDTRALGVINNFGL